MTQSCFRKEFCHRCFESKHFFCYYESKYFIENLLQYSQHNAAVDVADDLLQYFEDTYIVRYRRNASRRPSLFAINLWNMLNMTDDELPRTNNSVDVWHRIFPRPRMNMSTCALEIFIRPSKRKHDWYLDCPAPCETFSTT